MVGKRLLIGLPLAGFILAVLVLDGFLSTLTPPDWRVWFLDGNPARWLMNGALCTATAFVLTVLTTRELVHFARAQDYQPFAGLAQVFGAGLVIGPFIAFNADPAFGLGDEGWGMLWIACAVGTAFLLQGSWVGTRGAMGNLATTFFITFYAGGMAGFIPKLRMEIGGSTGIALVILSLFVVKMNDTGALFAGMWFGRHKMIPWLSPKKTWEGFVGGICVAILCALLIGSLLEWMGFHILRPGPLAYPWGLIVFGFVMAIYSVAGDLAASLLKRDAAVKDSGAALPGLGGVLDVFDSPLLAAPPAWFFWTRLVPALDLSTW